MSKLTYPLPGPPVLVAPVIVSVSDPTPAPPMRPTRRRIARPGRWALTIAATAVSTWALEGFATVAGVLLAASQVLQGAPRGLVIGLLVGSYLLWAAGLRANLQANWRLLEDTGTSTNAPSKACFELARFRSSGQRATRVASAAGYVATEIVKEAPYYAGAFGAALLSDAVDSTDALIFLSGTNVGAAVYEYALARLTRGYLNGRSRRLAGGKRPATAMIVRDISTGHAAGHAAWFPSNVANDHGSAAIDPICPIEIAVRPSRQS